MSSTIIEFPTRVAKSGLVRSSLLSLSKTIRRAIAHIGTMSRSRHDSSTLLRLDDRMLADIGLCRGEVEYAVRYGRWSAPSLADAGR